MDNKTVISICIALLLVGITLTLFTTGFFARSEKKQPAFLITGPSYSGKTSLFRKWTHGTVGDTVSSTTINTYDELKIPLDRKSENESQEDQRENVYRLIDIPGNTKLGFMETSNIKDNQYNLKGIIFMIDGAGGEERIKESAARLYKVVQQAEKSSEEIDILIAANKSDVFNFISPRRIRKILEEEIEELRRSKAKGIGDMSQNTSSNHDTADADDDYYDIGFDNEKGTFNFDRLDSIVTVLDGSIKNNTIQKWESWVEGHALN